MVQAPPRSNFAFVIPVWPALGQDAIRAERMALRQPDVTGMLARRIVEKVVKQIWRFAGIGETAMKDLNSLIGDPRFQQLAGTSKINALTIIRKAGNDSVHDSGIRPERAVKVVKHLFDVLSWAILRYSSHPESQPTEAFQEAYLKPPAGMTPQRTSPEELKKLADELDAKDKQLGEQELLLNESEQKLLEQQEAHAREKALFAQKQADTEEAHAAAQKALVAEIAQLRTQLLEAQRKKSNPNAAPLSPTISEAETRRDLIDPMLARAGFKHGANLLREFPVTGMPNSTGEGFVDYALMGKDGKPLGLLEAKRSSKSMNDGAVQAGLYADALEAQFGQRPIVFLTNGYHIQLVDVDGSSRTVEGYPTPDQLYSMIYHRAQRRRLADQEIDAQIAGRDYQMSMIRAVTERFENEGHRRALLVMATGTGKTRVAIALSKLMRGAKWAKKVLFLADRQALVEQAHENFVELYESSNPVNLLKNPDEIGDVYVSTYQTMMGMISDDGDQPAKFNPYDFDLIIIDEAHRSIYHRFKRILDYFDAYVLGLTATPKTDVHHDTYSLFHIDGKEPTGAYSLKQAIEDGNLVNYKTYAADSLFLRSGMRYDELSPEDKAAWDAQDWGNDKDGNPLPPPDGVAAGEINRVLYNRDTIRKVLAQLVERGHTVEGDQLGKTIIFARTQQHADLIKEEFDKHFPAHAGDGATVITHSTNYASTAIKNFKRAHDNPRVAISVDMLDTGIDVPEVVNLVFFKPVYSPTKFWQMVGRGTRLRKDLFGPGEDKKNFRIFDYCGNVESFSERAETDDSGTRPITLSEKLFTSRALLLAMLDKHDRTNPLRDELATYLHDLVLTVPEGNILVRPDDRPVLYRYQDLAAWNELHDVDVVVDHLAHLPFEQVVRDKESAKRVDLLVLQLQLGLLESSASFVKNKQKLEQVAGELLGIELAQVRKHAGVLERVLDPAWWEGVTLADLEETRVVIRGLAELIPRSQRKIVVFDFEDTVSDLEEVELNPVDAGVGVHESRIEARLREFFNEQKNTVAMQKLRTARPLTEQDIAALEEMVAQVSSEDVERVRESLGGGDSGPAFIRRLVGLEPDAVRAEFSDFLDGSTLTANQISFTKTLVEPSRFCCHR
ncbi:type I restriction-modification system, restriction subunit [Corynebacterium pilosum]|uniref:Type I restriction-modification system, restriction subunit n=2 Tax=Corynebacterium pilosum TaxID=35756 RepID=A0A376CLI7_9CORY|nr:type I restriction-modification system, restriction subunit [Corynebacterium pilosum]